MFPRYRHARHSNFVWCDGHVKAMKPVHVEDPMADVLSYMGQTGLDAQKGADILKTALDSYSSTVEYPKSQIAANLSSGNFALNLPIFSMYLNDLPAIKSWTSAQMGGKAGERLVHSQAVDEIPGVGILGGVLLHRLGQPRQEGARFEK